MVKKIRNAKENKFNIKVTKDGPYLISGAIPLSEQIINVDDEEQCHGWEEGKVYPSQEGYALCRCGHSQHKPYCDGTHAKIKFDGTEEATNISYLEQAKVFNGPDLTLTDARDFCVSARFCHRDGGTWNLTQYSDGPEWKQIAIEEAADCPSGRLITWEKDGTIIEPEFEPSIGLIEDPQAGKLGPIWVRGGIPVDSADGIPYETRKRITLCRCGKSSNKPFCDGSHLDE